MQAVDLTQLPAVACAVLQRCRHLNFDRGAAIHPTTGTRIEGLTNLTGSHPRVGSEYVVVTTREILPDLDDDELVAFGALDQSDPSARAEADALHRTRREEAMAAETIQTIHDVCNVRLAADDRKRVAVEMSATGDAPFDIEVRIEPPHRPTRAAVAAVVPVSGHWFVAGDVDVDGHLDIDALCGKQATSAPTAQVTARHRRGRCSIAIEIIDTGLGSWTVDGTLRVRGAGWFRPIAAVIGLVARPRLQRKLDEWLESGALDDFVSEMRTEFRAEFPDIADSSSDDIAIEIVDGFLDGLVEDLPASPLH